VNKAFTRETDQDPDHDEDPPEPPLPGGKNYISADGFRRLQAELRALVEVERPQVVETVHWAAKNGDRSENGDYLYGKKRLREIDRRIRFLTRRLGIAEVVDPSVHSGSDQVFFGATVVYIDDAGEEHTVRILGVDECDSLRGEVSWVSPIGRAFLRAREGDTVVVQTPAGRHELEIVGVQYSPKG
jgi:transcription elongation factor GreB